MNASAGEDSWAALPEVEWCSLADGDLQGLENGADFVDLRNRLDERRRHFAFGYHAQSERKHFQKPANVEAADRALNDFGLREHTGLANRFIDDEGVARAAFVHHHAIVDGRALDVDDAPVRIDVLGAVRTRIAVRAQPQIVFVDLRDALGALPVAYVFDEAVRVRNRGRTRERRIDA